jgi:nicotinamidase-related amidase
MENTALILIDLQNDYFESFEGAKWQLNNTEKAASNALRILTKFREKNMKIIHVRHEFSVENPPFFGPNTQGSKIHDTLTPKENEAQVLKHNVNAFKDTNLKEILNDSNITNVIIVGAMSYMCIDAVTRAASDFGYNCFVSHDACTTSNIEFNGIKIEAPIAHAAFMSALQFAYAKVETTDEILKLL